jgi:kinesin family protein 5
VHPSGRAVESLDGSYHFELDRAFGEAASQEEVFEYAARPIVDSVLAGYNGTVFAYGQTSGGKTYSMFGPDDGDGLQPELLGIVPRAAQQIFDYIEAYPDDDTEFTLRCSLLEVYQEKMKDLLRPTSEKLRVKDLPQKGLVIDGLSKEYVTCAGDVMEVLRAGYRARKVAHTRQNLHSSRSHAIFMLTVEQHSAVEGTERLGKLTLVDLAGSEKVSKSESVGQTLEEAKKINWSLSALGKVIDALAERRSHVPYRDSQLTRVLQEALGGNCRTTLLVAASACSQHWDETLSALRFASRTKKVRNLAKVNFMYSSDQLLMLVGQLQKELLGAKRQILNLGGISLERSKAAPRAQTVLRLGSSGSSPSFLKGADEVGYDLEVESCLAKTSIVSSSSSRLIGTPPDPRRACQKAAKPATMKTLRRMRPWQFGTHTARPTRTWP